jgi:hypothetical protein
MKGNRERGKKKEKRYMKEIWNKIEMECMKDEMEEIESKTSDGGKEIDYIT